MAVEDVGTRRRVLHLGVYIRGETLDLVVFELFGQSFEPLIRVRRCLHSLEVVPLQMGIEVVLSRISPATQMTFVMLRKVLQIMVPNVFLDLAADFAFETTAFDLLKCVLDLPLLFRP